MLRGRHESTFVPLYPEEGVGVYTYHYNQNNGIGHISATIPRRRRESIYTLICPEECLEYICPEEWYSIYTHIYAEEG
jgi:hypothetical protein